MMDVEHPSNQELISWEFHEFDPRPRSNSWYIWYGIIIAALVIYSIVTSNYLFAIILVLFSLIIFLQNWRRPDKLLFSIKGQGIQIGNQFYRMNEIEDFWIAYQPPNVEMVYFSFKASWRPVLGIPLENNNPLQVREILLEYLPENLDRESEPLPDAMARILKL